MTKDERYISISQSIIGSCAEVNLMRKGLLPERDWRDFFKKLKAEDEEEENHANRIDRTFRSRR